MNNDKIIEKLEKSVIYKQNEFTTWAERRRVLEHALDWARNEEQEKFLAHLKDLKFSLLFDLERLRKDLIRDVTINQEAVCQNKMLNEVIKLVYATDFNY